MPGSRLPLSFYKRDVLEVAPDLLGRSIVLKQQGTEREYIINETEAYRGGEDHACHASRGMTKRTEVMFGRGGKLYMYLVYGMYWMLNVVTAEEGNPQAVLIRGVEGFNGPGKLTREMGLDRSFYGEDLGSSGRIWIAGDPGNIAYTAGPRVGIDYAGEPWKSIPWRFIMKRV